MLYREVQTVKAGGYERFRINYTPGTFPAPLLWLKVKNTQLIALRAAYLTGPYVLYVDCRQDGYDPRHKCFITADQPVFEPQLLPGQLFYCELSCHIMKPRYGWTVDVISQILFNPAVLIDMEISIGTSKEVLKDDSSSKERGHLGEKKLLHVVHNNSLDLWNLPLPDPTRPIHLVILTHGLHLTASADLMYLKEQIDTVGKTDNLCVKAYFGNVGKTERGIKYLGSRVAEYIIDLVTTNLMFMDNKVAKISFVGHSLGGLVQTFAIAYLHTNFLWFFEKITPINFVTIALPLLGVANENPIYVNLALNAGVVGKTGQDLGLKQVEYDNKPLLLLLPGGPTHQVLKRFVRRTVYANAINDGIVPLRTLALLYLDYDELVELYNHNETEARPEEESGANGYEIAKVPSNPNSASGTFSMQLIISYLMPQKALAEPRSGPQVEADNGIKTKVENQSGAEIEGIPTLSIIESFPNVLLPPLPSMRYINDPDYRDNPILHDRVYGEADLPPVHNDADDDNQSLASSKKGESGYIELAKREMQKILDKVDFNLDDVEEAIAREYHRNMLWRKVIVKLKPDAHNNIVVRRRFANAYGWPVIDHVVSEHFGMVDLPEDTDIESVTEDEAGDDDEDIDMEGSEFSRMLTPMLSRDVIAKENDEIDRMLIASEEEDIDHQQWINAKEGKLFFASGPTGLLADVSEFVGLLKDGWIKDKSHPTDVTLAPEVDAPIMDSFAKATAAAPANNELEATELTKPEAAHTTTKSSDLE